ncbi:MAG: ABC transporter permease [Halobacteriota archaeon]
MKLSRVYGNFISNLKIFFRGRGSVFWVFAFPIVIMLIFGAIFGGGNTQYGLAIQNRDNSTTAASFINAVNATNAFKVHMINASEDPDAYVKSNNIAAVLIVPQGFGNKVKTNAVIVKNLTGGGQAGTNVSAVNTTLGVQASQARTNNTNFTAASVILKVDQSSTTAPLISGVLNSIVHGFNAQLTGSKQVVGIQNQQVLSAQFTYIDFFVPGIIGLTVLFTGVLQTVGNNTQYRNKGVLKKLATTPLTKSEWIFAKILYQSVQVFISAALILIVAKLVYDIQVVPDAVTLLLLFVGTICFTGIGMILAHFVKDEDAAQAAGSAIVFPLLFLSGTIIPIETMPDYLQVVARVLPLTYLNNGLRDAMILGDTGGALHNMSIVLVFGIIFFIIGSLITDWREDGKPILLERLSGAFTGRKAIVTGIVAVVLLVVTAVSVVSLTQAPQPQPDVHSNTSMASPSPSPTSVPRPTSTPVPRPTSTPVPTPTPTPFPTPTPTPFPTATPTVSPTATPTPFPTPTPTVTPVTAPATTPA